MTERPRVPGGHNGSTLIEQLAQIAQRRQGGQDPQVLANCDTVLAEAVELCYRFDQAQFGDESKLPSQVSRGFVAVRTPEVTYQSEYNEAELPMYLSAYALRGTEPDGPPTSAYSASLWVQGRFVYSPAYSVKQSEFTYGIAMDKVPGTLGELNIFRGIIDKIRTVHFPKSASERAAIGKPAIPSGQAVLELP